MRSKQVVLLLCFLCFALIASAQPEWGIGVRVGEPSGLSIKRYLRNDRALDFNIGFTDFLWEIHIGRVVGSRPGFNVMGQYLWQKETMIDRNLDWYFGPGILLNYQKYCTGNCRREDYVYRVVGMLTFAGGVEYHFDGAPISIFGDVMLAAELIPSVFLFRGKAGVGIRYDIY